MRHRTVNVWGKPLEIAVEKISKAVWVASGEYMGEYHQAKDRSEGTAMKRWQEWAKYKGG